MIYIDKNESPVTPLDEKTMTMQHMNNSRTLMLSFTDYRLNKLL